MSRVRNTAKYVEKNLKNKIQNFGFPKENTKTVLRCMTDKKKSKTSIDKKSLSELNTGLIMGAVSVAKELEDSSQSIFEGIFEEMFLELEKEFKNKPRQ